MKLLKLSIIYFHFSRLFVGINTEAFYGNSTCGVDNSPITVIYEGIAKIETYPWLGMLFYPLNKKRLTTAVVLVTKQMVLASASEIDRLPKQHFRALTRVVLGTNCRGPSLRIRDYTYHPDYSQNTYSALAMIQLEVDHVKRELRPICPPPTHFHDPTFYAMTVSDCKKATVRIHKMQYVNNDRCRHYYRKFGLDVDSMWPSYTACAQAQSGGHCVWRSGAALMVRQDGLWRLLGFGVYGPGCQAPARFLDYGMYHEWVHQSIQRIGNPAITKLASNHIIMRRTLSSVQRFGPCDPEEMQKELFSDRLQIVQLAKNFKVRYNVSLYANVEYSCIVFRVLDIGGKEDKNVESIEDTDNSIKPDKSHENVDTDAKINNRPEPKIYLRRWCAGSNGICFGFEFLEIHFYVEIVFSNSVVFKVIAYGKEAKIIDPTKALAYANKYQQHPPIYTYDELQKIIIEQKARPNRTNLWFYRGDY